MVALYEVIKKRLPAALEAKFAEFPEVLINTHGKDLTVNADPSRTGTPTPSGSAAPATATSTNAPPAPTPKPAKKENVNTATVSVNANLVASADDLFSLLTDPGRLPAWTHAAAQVCGFIFDTVHIDDLDAVVVPNSRRRILAVRRRCQWQVHLTYTRKRDRAVVEPQESDMAIGFVVTTVNSVRRV